MPSPISKLKKKPPKISVLKKKLDKIFSEYVRLSNADKHGNVKCITCGVKKHWRQMQASHFRSRSQLILRYDERNVFPACVGCNIFKSGNIPNFSIFLEKKYGHGILQELEKESRKIFKVDAEWYLGKIYLYNEKLKSLGL